MLPEEPVENSQTEELDSNLKNMGKTVRACLIFHSNSEKVFKRQKISNDPEGNH